MKRSYFANGFLIFLITLTLSGIAFAEASNSIWKAGRAKVEANNDGLVLRLSVRNEGVPARDSLEVIARWKDPEGDYTSLGTYSKEVALKQTAILAIPLQALGTPPKEKASLELVIKTASQETDRKLITLP